ncbi:MAG: PH domain-containing protein [Candidatus Micrarchaeota archaeon]|nr:PH domain-containing protein [Candidatus Micrarchaeota archaeon]
MPTPRHLNPKVKWVWFLPVIGLLLVVWLVVTVFLFMAQPDVPVFGFSRGVFSPLLILFLLVFIGGPVYAYNHIEYMSFTYELTETEFIIRQGVFTRDTIVIPYNRIQNVNTHRTLLERLLGLASLQIETAGTNLSASEGTLPGVSRKDELVHEIMAHVEAAKGRGGVDGNGNGGASKTEAQLLSDILKELVLLNKNISGKSASPEPANRPAGGHWPRMSPAPPTIAGKPKPSD